MPHLLHPNAKTTPRVRKEIQQSQESIAKLAKRYGINEKTVLKWKHADTVEDRKSGPPKRSGSVLTELDEQVICFVRKQLRLPLDDLYIILKPHMPKLSRSNLHRCLQYYGLSRLPKEDDEAKVKHKPFKDYPIGYVHIDITELLCGSGKYYLFVGIERSTKYVYVELHQRQTANIAADFLKNMQADCPFKITHVLTDNGAQFTYNLLAAHLKPKDKQHVFDAVCQSLTIEHRTTQFRHPWTNGQVEVTNKMLKQATTRTYHYKDLDSLKKHLMAYVLYYNHQKPLKSKKFKTPWQLIEASYTIKPQSFLFNPNDKIVGLNSYSVCVLWEVCYIGI